MWYDTFNHCAVYVRKFFLYNGNAIHIKEHVQNEHDVDDEFDILRDLSNETLLSCFDSGVVKILAALLNKNKSKHA